MANKRGPANADMSELIEDDRRLHELIASGKDTLVLFYASWCPFSRAFLPVFEKNACGPGCVRVLTDKAEGVEESFAIDFVPTVMFFHKGKLHMRLNGIAGEGLTEAMLLGLMRTCGVKPAQGVKR